MTSSHGSSGALGSSNGLWNVNALLNQKDSRWLQLEVCREFLRNVCSRSDTDCKFAHPNSNVEVQNGRVTACYDSIKGRCNREQPPCKYFHPPLHLKDQLLVNGRNHLSLKNALLNQMTHLLGQPLLHGQIHTVSASPFMSTALPGLPYSHYAASSHYLPSLTSQFLTNSNELSGGADPMALFLHHYHQQQQQQQQQQQMVVAAASAHNLGVSKARCDRIGVCREFQRGSCTHSDCRLAHPSEDVSVSNDGSVILCIDHEKRRCYREACRYFHRPSESSSTNTSNLGSMVLPLKTRGSSNKTTTAHQQTLYQLQPPFVPITYTSPGSLPRFQ